MKIAAGLLFLAMATAMSAQIPMTYSVDDNGVLTVQNLDPSRPIIGFHLSADDSQITALVGDNILIAVDAGKQAEFGIIPIADYTIDGVLFSDGSTAGVNKWGIDRHYKLRQDIMRGGPAFPTATMHTESGDSSFFAWQWARMYRRKHGHDAVVLWPQAPRGPAPVHPDTSTIVQGTYRLSGYYDSTLMYYGVGPSSQCQEDWNIMGGIIHTTYCKGYAQCSSPPSIPGKGSTNAKMPAFSGCPGANIQATGDLTENPPYPFSTIWANYADGLVQLPVGLSLTGYQVDTCEFPQYTSPLQITNRCMN